MRRSGSVLLEERHWLPVRINGAFPNQPPKASFSNMYILEVDQFVLTNLLPMTMSAVDEETRNDQLIFNITKPPSMGFITHLQDQTKPISSFWQQDLQDLQIAYQPPNVSFTERQTFEVEFVVYDAYFAQSEPIRALFSVRVAYTNAPRVSWNMGLTMLEGQSRVIDNNCLQVVDKDNLNQVQFTLAGGLRHGRLHVGERPGFSFGWSDVVNGLVSYRHDDTDTRSDFINFRITDRTHSVRFKLPITILPKDDAPPFLINNIVFEVQEGQTILIHRFMLEASDADTAADYVTFNITTPPRAGEVQKRRTWERVGWAINSFQQLDLYQGLIYYKHLGGEVFEDFFEFILVDANRPTPNSSPVHRAVIKITPIDDLLPEAGPGNSLALTVNETDVVYITSEHINYIDTEQENSDVTYTITTDLYRIDGTERSAGKLIFTDDMVMLMKDPTVPTLRTFTQTAINHNKVAYMPPIQDIGGLPVDIQFRFSISDDGGKQITGKTFAITILPVNNQAPIIQVTEMCLDEGGTELIAPDIVQLQDEDTELESLRVVLSEPPMAGSVRNNNIPLRQGDSFTLHDVELFRMTYVHNGSEIHNDRFRLTVTDGKQNNSVVMRVKMDPVDDEQPVILVSNSSLHVPEDGATVLTKSFLSATDVDSMDEQLIFEVLTPPRLGSFQINNETVMTFLQQDVTQGRVSYVHNGREIGKMPQRDLATIMVSDRRGQPVDDKSDSVKTEDLRFTIVPVNSRAPSLALGHRVFRCSEGDAQVISHNYIMADDEDTPVDQLRYLVESSPTYGYVEDITPRPGYESRTGSETTSFTHQQLLSGYIRYKQANHQGIEPTSDQFTVAVTDGQFKSASVPFLISITPTNDEFPIISVENVTCNEGHMKTISLDVQDLDMPKDKVMILVVEPPQHGMIVNEMEMISRMRRSSNGRQNRTMLSDVMHHMEPITEFSMKNVKANQIIPTYVHDGSESNNDEFKIKITDGRHVSKKLLMVKVMPVNDEPPRIATNRGISVEFGETKVISGFSLHSTDDDNSDLELEYRLHSFPKRGELQLKRSESTWATLSSFNQNSFTQEDVEMNRLRYVHGSTPGSKKDFFRFSVSDGEFETVRQKFRISITDERRGLRVTTHPIRVNEKEQAFLSSEVLTTSYDASQNPEHIVYLIERKPMLGQIERISSPGVSIDFFSHLDILSRNVVYVHTSKEDLPVDTFQLEAANGDDRVDVEVSVLITPVDSELPVLVTGENGTQTTFEAPHVSLYRGATVSISQSILRIEDSDSPKKNLKLIILSLPEHGNLMMNGVSILDVNTEVSEFDLESSNFFYHHNQGAAEIDRFSFTVTDGAHSQYIYKGVVKKDPINFYFNIESLDETAPEIITNLDPLSIDPIGNGRLYGISLDSHFLEARDEHTDNPHDITFTIASPPSYGHLALKSDRDLSASIHRFTQFDLNRRSVVYVIAGRLEATNDSFLFDVEDSWGNTLLAQRFSMSWSRVEVVKKKIKVCEYEGMVAVQVRRYGNTMTSSFIGVKLKRGTATPGIDFLHSSANQIQFDQDSRLRSWNINILNDTWEERVEKIKIEFGSPVNCVLVPKKTSTLIIILDKRHRTCQKRRHKAKAPKKQKQARRKNFSQNNVASSAVQTTGRRKVRYGKLPPGTTVAPQTFFRNKTVRIWRYHALLPATIDEDYEERIGNLKEPVPINSGNSIQAELVSPSDVTQETESLQDDPNVVQRKSNTISNTFHVENTNISAVITIRDRTERVRSVLPTSVRQKCNLAKTGSLYFDSTERVLYQCDGARWIPWRKPRKRAKTSSSSLSMPSCNRNWIGYKNKCYWIGFTTESWNSAQRICREQHSANLVTINGKKLLKWIRKIVKRRALWIGLNRKFDPLLWEWVSGEKFTFTNWKRNFPSTNRKNCALMGSNGQWMDASCSRPDDVNFVCEKSP